MQTINIPTSDGYTLSGTIYHSDLKPDKILLINPAVAVPQRYYSEFAQFMVQKGYTVYTYDYRGIGASKYSKLKGFKADMQDWATKDLTGVLSFIQERHPNISISVVGHSFGGNCLGLNEKSEKIFDKIVMVGSQHGYYGHYWASKKPLLFALWNIFIPTFSHLYGYFPSQYFGMGEQLPKGVALEWAKICRNPQWLFAYLPENKNYYGKIKQPLLAISIEDDWYAPKKAVEKLFEDGYKNAQAKRLHLYPKDFGMKEIGHFGFFKKKNKEQLWHLASDFLND